MDALSIPWQGMGLLLLSSVQAVAHCTGQVPTKSRLSTDTHSSSAIVSVLDARIATVESGRAVTSGGGRSSVSHSRGPSGGRYRRSTSLPAVRSSRLATLKALFRQKGYSARAAEVMSQTLRQSSVHLHETHWQRFVQWCRDKNLNVFAVSSAQFSNYMMSLFDDQMTPSTIISHRTSIASVLRHWRYDPATDPQIRLLLRGFRMARPRQRISMPKWDLHLVLQSLFMPPYVSGPPFSTDDAIPLK